MPWRQLPDGSFLDENTGTLRGLDGKREAAARAVSQRATGKALPPLHQRNPFPPLPQQKMVVLPGVKGPQQIIDPAANLLAVNPFELGLGAMSETTKRMMMVGAFVAIAFGAVWITNKTKKHKKA